MHRRRDPLAGAEGGHPARDGPRDPQRAAANAERTARLSLPSGRWSGGEVSRRLRPSTQAVDPPDRNRLRGRGIGKFLPRSGDPSDRRSEEHTSELQSLMRISYAVFCLEKNMTNSYINSKTS